MFDVLFEKYLEDLKTGNESTTISRYIRNFNDNIIGSTPLPRIVCDYIAGMTDDYFNKEFREFIIPKSFGYKIK